MKTDMRVIVELSEYDQEMMLAALIHEWRRGDQQVKDWALEMVLRIDPSGQRASMINESS